MANADFSKQVLLNIILNARDAMEQGGTLTGDDGPRNPLWATIRISDTGSGIEPDEIQKLFLPLFTRKGEGNGTGLGALHKSGHY